MSKRILRMIWVARSLSEREERLTRRSQGVRVTVQLSGAIMATSHLPRVEATGRTGEPLDLGPLDRESRNEIDQLLWR